MKIGIIVGSLRKGSFNRKLAEISKNIINEGNEAEIIDISYLPFYNQDDDGVNPREEMLKSEKNSKNTMPISSLPQNTTAPSPHPLKTS